MARENLPQIRVTPNNSRRTFTIRKQGSKYRTTPMSKTEFHEAGYWTENDWRNFLKTNDYSVIK